MATARVINVHDATIKTAAVEIKSLTVNGKQITLAVFRQIEEKDIIEYNGTGLLGIPWGWVNYCPGKGQCQAVDADADQFIEDKQDAPRWRRASVRRPVTLHRHLVWQDGDELRRMALPIYERVQGVWYGGREDTMRLLRSLRDVPQLFIAV